MSGNESEYRQISVQPSVSSALDAGRPYSAYFEVEYGCNFRCTYCYIGEKDNYENKQIPDLATIERSMTLLRENGIQEIIFLGGEPTIHPNFVQICDKANTLGFAPKGIVTNGYTMNEKRAEALRRNGFWVDITFRGGNSNTFDDITKKPGSFDRAVKAAQLLTQEGMDVGIEYDCTPQNYLEIYDLMKYLQEKGVSIRQLQLHRIMPEGDASNRIDDFFLGLDQWQEVFEQLRKTNDELKITAFMEDGFPYCLTSEENWRLMEPCVCGVTHITVAPNGEVRECSCIREPIGNIHTDSFEDITQKLSLHKDSFDYPEPCNSCTIVEICRGGCEASGSRDGNQSIELFHEHLKPFADIVIVPQRHAPIGQQWQVY